MSKMTYEELTDTDSLIDILGLKSVILTDVSKFQLRIFKHMIILRLKDIQNEIRENKNRLEEYDRYLVAINDILTKEGAL